MKTKTFFAWLWAFALILFATLAGVAQETIELPAPADSSWQLQDFIDLYGALEAAIIVILGYLHNFIPGLNKIPSKWMRVVLIGLVVIVIFTALGWQTGFGQVLVFLQAVGFYEIILKKVAPSPPAKDKESA